MSGVLKEHILSDGNGLTEVLTQILEENDSVECIDNIVRSALKLVLRSDQYVGNQNASQRFEYVASFLSGALGCTVELRAHGGDDEVVDEDSMQLHNDELMRVIRQDALCRGVHDGRFFPERGQSTRPAKDICNDCDVREDCLEYALITKQKFGIWGGLAERERRRLRKARRAAARSVEIST